jgi:hypothetical protein
LEHATLEFTITAPLEIEPDGAHILVGATAPMKLYERVLKSGDEDQLFGRTFFEVLTPFHKISPNLLHCYCGHWGKFYELEEVPLNIRFNDVRLFPGFAEVPMNDKTSEFYFYVKPDDFDFDHHWIARGRNYGNSIHSH